MVGFLVGVLVGWLISVILYTIRLVQDKPKWKFSKQHGKMVTMRIIDQEGNHITWSNIKDVVDGK